MAWWWNFELGEPKALAPLMLELARAREQTDLLLPPVLAQDEVKDARVKLFS